MRRIGTWLVAVGAILTVLGLYGLNTTMVNCPANGCSSSELWAIYGPYEISLWSGVILLISGVAMVTLSYFVPAPRGAVADLGRKGNRSPMEHNLPLSISLLTV